MKKDGIKTTVVCPSFINTGMFEGAGSTYVNEFYNDCDLIFVNFSDLTPLLNQESVCNKIVKAIRQNTHMLLIPKSLIVSLVLNRFE